MKINKKADKLDYCVWFLSKVKNLATASEMVEFAEKNELINKGIKVSAKSLGMIMKGHPQVFGRLEGVRPVLWRLQDEIPGDIWIKEVLKVEV